jgi:hypothetical protein
MWSKQSIAQFAARQLHWRNICLFCHGLWCSLCSMGRNVPIQPTQFIPFGL